MLPPLLFALCQIKGNIPLNLKYASEWGSMATGPIGQADKLSHSMMGTGLRQTAWVPVESLPAPLPGCHRFFLPVVTLCWLLFPPLPFHCVHQASLRWGKNSRHSEQKTSLARVHSHEWARTVIQSHLLQSVVRWLCVSDSVCLNMRTLFLPVATEAGTLWGEPGICIFASIQLRLEFEPHGLTTRLLIMVKVNWDAGYLLEF